MLLAVGVGNSVMVPPVVILPILLAPCSVNQRLPSAPAAIAYGKLSAVGIRYSAATHDRHDVGVDVAPGLGGKLVPPPPPEQSASTEAEIKIATTSANERMTYPLSAL
jgi:hypothetical protein